MQISEGIFTGTVGDDRFVPKRNYRLDITGIKQRVARQPHPWTEVEKVEAWKTASNDEFDEVWHLRITYHYGYRLHVSDYSPDTFEFFSDILKAVKYYLGIEIDWRGGKIDAEYQQREQRWHGGWLSGSHKPVVYTKMA